MLFSNTKIANHISENFEPVWQSLRPVPKVSIDFGGGKVVTRTLHGNVASFICSADGAVLDILPGVYDPDSYLDELKKIEKVVANLPQDKEKRMDLLHEYHAENLRPHPGSTVSRPGLLTADTVQNQMRRLQIHGKLVQGSVKPQNIEKWLYKSVLHADLDDPYLGLQNTLFASYPFDDNLPTHTP